MSSKANLIQSTKKVMKPLSLIGSLLLFGLPTVYFIGITKFLIPLLKESGVHPALSWFLGGTAVFLPLFVLAIILVKAEGVKITIKELLNRLRVRKPNRNDIKWSLISLVLVFALSGIIMVLSQYITSLFDLPPLNLSPEFTRFEPLRGSQIFLLLVWLVMFFFNIMGEELLWRGYILPRQELRFGKYAWLINSVFWMMFHICFGIELMLILIPVIVILPYVVQKTCNTTNGIIIHGLYNGPMFILVALGVIK